MFEAVERKKEKFFPFERKKLNYLSKKVTCDIAL